jgi:hypothetical protein
MREKLCVVNMNEQGRKEGRKEAVMTYQGWTEEKSEPVQPVHRSIFKPGTSRTQATRVTYY